MVAEICIIYYIKNMFRPFSLAIFRMINEKLSKQLYSTCVGCIQWGGKRWWAMCPSVIQKPQQRGCPDPQGLSSHWAGGSLYLRVLFDPPKTARKAKIHVIIFHFPLSPYDKLWLVPEMRHTKFTLLQHRKVYKNSVQLLQSNATAVSAASSLRHADTPSPPSLNLDGDTTPT